jgi:hypothetical protein
MPNHVQVVFTPLPKAEVTFYPLAQSMRTMKGYTAGRANRLLSYSAILAGKRWL